MISTILCVVLATQAEGAIRPAVAIFGSDSAVKVKSYAVAANDDEWTALWAKHRGLEVREVWGKNAPMEVHFTKYILVAVFQGDKWNSNGVKCVEAISDGQRMTIRFDDMSFQTAGPDGGGVRVTPFGMFVFPKGATEIVFEENVQALKNHPADWKERARIKLS